jgi:hypothetical protein
MIEIIVKNPSLSPPLISQRVRILAPTLFKSKRISLKLNIALLCHHQFLRFIF